MVSYVQYETKITWKHPLMHRIGRNAHQGSVNESEYKWNGNFFIGL